MSFLNKLFSSSRKKISFKEFHMKKTHLERLIHYYQDKIDYLSSPKIPPSLATIVCRDVPRHQTLGARQSGPRHIKMCRRYYKKRLYEVGRDLKKIL